MSAMIDWPTRVEERAMMHPRMVEWDEPFLALAGGVCGHHDFHFPVYSAFLTLRNDGCTVWQEGGYRGVPAVGERFVLNIHRRHGVSRCRRDQLIVLLCADADTIEEAQAKLAAVEAKESA